MRGMKFSNPAGSLTVECHSDAFVDDTQNGINDAGLVTLWALEELKENLEDMSRKWEKLLFCSRGALAPDKCFYYLLYWQWKQGVPIMMRKMDMDISLC